MAPLNASSIRLDNFNWLSNSWGHIVVLEDAMSRIVSPIQRSVFTLSVFPVYYRCENVRGVISLDRVFYGRWSYYVLPYLHLQFYNFGAMLFLAPDVLNSAMVFFLLFIISFGFNLHTYIWYIVIVFDEPCY